MRVGVVYEVVPHAECLICGHKWVAIIESDQIVWPDGKVDIKYVDRVECPSCHKMTTVKRDTDKMLKKIIEEFPEEKIIRVNKFDEAIIGIDEESMRLVYSIAKCIKILMKEGLDEETAYGHLYFDVIGENFGAPYPIWVTDNL